MYLWVGRPIKAARGNASGKPFNSGALISGLWLDAGIKAEPRTQSNMQANTGPWNWKIIEKKYPGGTFSRFAILCCYFVTWHFPHDGFLVEVHCLLGPKLMRTCREPLCCGYMWFKTTASSRGIKQNTDPLNILRGFCWGIFSLLSIRGDFSFFFL